MPGTNLTRSEAIERSSKITVEHYDVVLDLTQGDKTFRSETTVKFKGQSGASTFIDLIAPKVHAIELNGKELPLSSFQDSRINLDNIAAENVLHVVADCAYMHTGEGMHRFVDPTDNEAYVYTQFEVPDARRVFTVFEQPDQKATFTFTVTVPQHWVVLSNSPTPTPTKADGKATFEFSQGPKISSYITAIVAGPYKCAHTTIRSVDGREIPSGVYARSSMMKHMDPDNIFKLTQQGFEFFEKMYGEPYPFDKYDHIFVPEYNAGAMENAGCITYTESYVFTSTPTDDVVEARANTILHELAHMWFGDLITMKWWNDLWLNESFAEFMSHLALAEATEFTEAWVGFGSRKLWGMRADQMPSTHPIVAPIKDLADVEVNFDGITYAKGAAVLRQLIAYIGRDAFERGLQSYFAKYKWTNTELKDLLSEFAAASGKDLDTWSRLWLEESGITQLRTKVTYDGDQIASLSVAQELVMDNTSLRPQAATVAGVQLNPFKVMWELPVTIDGADSPVNGATKLPRPEAIILNSTDDAYAKIRFDEDSLQALRENLAAVADPTMRLVVVMSLWDMLRDGELSPCAYVDTLEKSLPTERQATIMGIMLSTLVTAVTSYTLPAKREATAKRVGAALEHMIRELPAGSSAQQQVANALVSIAVDEQLDLLAGFARGETINGLELGDKLRWRSIITLAASGRDVTELVAAQAQRDPSLSGQEFKAAALGLMDLPRTWATLFEDDSLSNGKIQIMLRSWNSCAWRLDLAPIIGDFWERIIPTWQKRTFHVCSLLLELLFPSYLAGMETSFDVEAATLDWLSAHADESDALKRMVIEGLDGYRRVKLAQQS